MIAMHQCELNNVHVNMRCDGKCPRMSNYDKRNKLNSLGRAL